MSPRLRRTSFQSCWPCSEFIGGAGNLVLRMAATEEVSTTRFTLALALMTAPITFSVPWGAGPVTKVVSVKAADCRPGAKTATTVP